MKKNLSRILILLLSLQLFLNACGPAPSDPTGPVVAATEAAQNIIDTVTVPEDTEASTQAPMEIPEDSMFEVHFIDVGQADAALVLCDDTAMLIDGGNSEDSSLMYAYLKAHGVTHLDVTVATHGHEDHVGGLSGALNYATTDIAYCPVTSYDSKAFENFKKTLAKQDCELTAPSHGQSFYLGSSLVEILGPISHSDEPNNTSIVLRITYGDTRFLFTGDAETLEENEILDAGYDIKCDVLKVGHHGSDTSTGYRWLREAAPLYAVISVGQDNTYGHPNENTLSKLRDADVITFRTDMQGHIICTSDGSTVAFEVERNDDADTLSGAGAGGNHKIDSAHSDYGDAAADSLSDQVTYIVNINTGKFHEPSCSSVDQMSEKNKLEVAETRETLISSGYSPCGRCKP